MRPIWVTPAALLLLFALGGELARAESEGGERARTNSEGGERARANSEDGERARAESEGGVRDGAAITHEFAQKLFDRMAPLRETDGCVLSRFNTSRFRIIAGLMAPSGVDHTFEFATGSIWGNSGRRVGSWRLVAPEGADRECAATIAAIERVLHETPAPRAMSWEAGNLSIVQWNEAVLAASFVLLALGSAFVLLREARAHRAALGPILALTAVSLAALALRLSLSPRTFLHEYYHIAETIAGYLAGSNPPTYGNAGPAMYRLAGAVLGRPYDVDIVFLTNAVLASLAVPAIALLDLAIFGRWPRAICAGLLLCILPQHLRFSASEILFIPAITFAIWSLALGMLYVRTRRLLDAVLCVLALSLAMQTRPELLLFPGVVAAMVLLLAPRSWRVLVAPRTMLALALLGVLLASRLLQLGQVLGDGSSPVPQMLGWQQYAQSLILLDESVTPRVYPALLVAGALWALWRAPGLLVWSALAYGGYTLFSLSLYSNPPYNVRTQLLPMALLIPLAAGAAALWIDLWGDRRRRQAIGLGVPLLVALAAAITVGGRGFVTELRDQQLEWQFLRDTVPTLPAEGRLLAAVEIGGRNLNGFPDYLLRRGNKRYEAFDVRNAAGGAIDWPAAGDDLLYYQGMYCYFAFDDQPSPDPMTAACRAVHERYTAQPLVVADLDTRGYSWMRYARGPYRIGFYRLLAR
jgi:hypothetical protein